ncbi:fumarylacetoacetate hydrolase family protein [Actinospica durhamensis]|uniref:Fumarylacetoacetate hydrolase family protein n=1 Tax=Actinospica durhamensis TaxID=1508375 RepID=A0A941EJL6_9ACTN|nr:fumarylacetoacetate hydrolase family protein [Actinospica durhamensis]
MTAIVEDEHLALVEGDPFTGHRRTGERIPLAAAVFLPPVIPPTFYAVGYNYAAHNAQAAARTSTAAMATIGTSAADAAAAGASAAGAAAAHVPVNGAPAKAAAERPEVGYRAQSALIGHGAAVIKPADCTGPFECEAELVAVIGRDLRRASRDEAADAVFGWTVGNDVSARTWQRADRTLWRAKNSDTFKPMGPWIETDLDPLADGVATTVSIDGVPVAAFPTGTMIFDPYAYIQEISRYITLRAGDVLWMGTDAMVEMPVGSTLAIDITGLGTLANPVTEES